MAVRQLKCQFLSIVLILFLSLFVHADPAVVTEEGAVVFTQPNFDAPVLTTLHEGDRIEASIKAFGAFQFHRVRLPDGRLGFMADNEFKSGAVAKKNSSQKPAVEKQRAHDEVADEHKRKKPFSETKFRGVTVDEVNFRENTMGLSPTAQMMFFGFKLLGPDLLFEGDTNTEFNLNLSPSPPHYYQQATGNSATGYIIRTDYMMEGTFPESRRVLTYLGIGPTLRYSSFQVALNSGGSNTNSYSLTDIVLGVTMNAGLGFNFGPMALRVEYKLYWDKLFMNDIQMAFLFPF